MQSFSGGTQPSCRHTDNPPDDVDGATVGIVAGGGDSDLTASVQNICLVVG